MDGSGAMFHLNDLKESNEFLNTLLDNINSAVFIVDEQMCVREFNRGLKILFGKSDVGLAGELCGNALGCVFAVREKTACGKSSQCGNCRLRATVRETFHKGTSMLRQKLVREFYVEGRFVKKHLEYSTKCITFYGREMTLIIVDDVTESETQRLEILEKQRHIEEDLKAAAGIQQSLLPQRAPRIAGIEVAWKFLPCTYVGGDLFNVFTIRENLVGGYILDVSGHGVPSAFVTLLLSKALQPDSEDRAIRSPREVCTLLDREFPLQRFNTFITMVYFLVDLKTGVLSYCNAGHPPWVLLHENGDVELLDRGGAVLGLDGMLPFEEGRMKLREGDVLVFYTDGLLEHQSPEQEFYGSERFYETLRALHGKSLQDLLHGVIESVQEFGKGREFMDDVSLMGIRYRKK